MKIVFFGLSISSAWGNGQATLLRSLFRALDRQGHEIHFFERDTPYYAAHRDAASFPFAHLHIYSEWPEVLEQGQRELSGADAGIVTSYCPDGVAACDLVLKSKLPRTVFYDMDTPVTLSRLESGESVPYIPPYGLGPFDLVLSYTGGRALDLLRDRLSARCVSTLYGWVDPELYHRVDSSSDFESDLSYLGTYSPDRQTALDELLIAPARQLPSRKFLIAGAMYSSREVWPPNIRHFEHIAPPQHPSFYSSSPLTLNVTRGPMAVMGYCPSARFFEAGACGTAVLSDWWTGLDSFFEPGSEILIATSTAQAISAIVTDRASLDEIARRARQRTLDCHTADQRARRLIGLLESPRDEPSEVHEGAYASKGV